MSDGLELSTTGKPGATMVTPALPGLSITNVARGKAGGIHRIDSFEPAKKFFQKQTCGFVKGRIQGIYTGS
jgi:hypothetical protein